MVLRPFAAIQKLQPDVVFLDVEMPGLDGFAVLDSLPQDEWPVVIFTTAYGHYAIRAFEVHALDYLLKPITQKRLAECLSRLDVIRPAAHALTWRKRGGMAEAGAPHGPVELKAHCGECGRGHRVRVRRQTGFPQRTAHGRFVLNIQSPQ